MLNLRSAGVVQEDARVIWRTICFGHATNWIYRKIFLENVRIAIERGLLHLLKQKNYLWIFQRRRSGPGGRCTWFWMILQHGNRRLWAAAMPEHRGPKRRWSAQRLQSNEKLEKYLEISMLPEILHGTDWLISVQAFWQPFHRSSRLLPRYLALHSRR